MELLANSPTFLILYKPVTNQQALIALFGFILVQLIAIADLICQSTKLADNLQRECMKMGVIKNYYSCMLTLNNFCKTILS